VSARLEPNQSMRHKQHVRVVDVHISESRRLNLHDVTVDQNSTDMLQSSSSTG
jgi:hypothetical protein